ncbi:MAG: RraA family protein [Gemmataceae bacterium]|nr:RraA family protein [Gemmataceae bacterium]
MKPAGWEKLSSALLADVLDALGHRRSALPIDLRTLREGWRILGPAATLSAMPVAADPAKPYEAEMACIDGLKAGEVLVAATGADRSCALWGELLSTSARARGAVGVVTDGLTRDAAQILAMDFPVWAAGFSPLDSRGRLDCVAHGVPVRLGECVVEPGDWIFADIDGIVAVPKRLADEAFRRALEKATGENKVRDELARGRPLREVFAEYGIL